MTSLIWTPAGRSRQRHNARLRLSALLAGWLLLASGCTSVGQDFPASRIPEIRIGQTTQADIRDIFGSPWRVGMENGQRTWTYGRYYYSAAGEKQAKDLVVRFDPQGVVSSYTYSTTDHDQ